MSQSFMLQHYLNSNTASLYFIAEISSRKATFSVVRNLTKTQYISLSFWNNVLLQGLFVIANPHEFIKEGTTACLNVYTCLILNLH